MTEAQMSNETQHTPADVRGRIIRASILPIEDEETMIAGLRAGAEAVERGELDVDDFVGVWSQYLRELFRRASSVPAPADVRELAVEIIRSLDLIARNYDSYEYGLPVMTHYDEMVDTVAALLRTPRGEGEASGLAECIITCMGCGQDFDANDDAQARYHEAACEVVDHEPARVEIARRLRGAALRSEAQGEEKPVAWLVERRGVEMFGWHPVHVYLGKQNAENIARVLRDGEWDVRVVPLYRATRRPEAQGEDRWEDLIFSTLIEAYNEAHAALRDGAQGEG